MDMVVLTSPSLFNTLSNLRVGLADELKHAYTEVGNVTSDIAVAKLLDDDMLMGEASDNIEYSKEVIRGLTIRHNTLKLILVQLRYLRNSKSSDPVVPMDDLWDAARRAVLSEVCETDLSMLRTAVMGNTQLFDILLTEY